MLNPDDPMNDPVLRARAEQWVDLIEAAARDFQFPQHPNTVGSSDEAGTYLRRLIEHVDTRDLARGYELRIGFKQAEWSKDHVEAFAKFMIERPRGNPDHFTRSRTALLLAEHKISGPVDAAALRNFVDSTLAHLAQLRTEGPTSELPILVLGLLADGQVLTTSVDRGDRIAFVTMLARTRPLFGWLVGADMFVHKINKLAGTASKVDAIGVHYGTRASRGFLVREYAVVDGAVRWASDRNEDYFESGHTQVEDPYAFVFAPPTSGAPS